MVFWSYQYAVNILQLSIALFKLYPFGKRAEKKHLFLVKYTKAKGYELYKAAVLLYNTRMASKNNNRKTGYGLTADRERNAARIFGKHVSDEKALILVLATSFACLSPVLLGLRLWNAIPALVETGLIRPDGNDDSVPRAVLVYAVPGLVFVLNLICHVQLWVHQKAQRMPPKPVLFLGRHGIPLLFIPLTALWMLHAAGEPLQAVFFLTLFASLLMMLIGASFYDCPPDAVIAIRLFRLHQKPSDWAKVHRLAGICWMAAGLLQLIFLFAFDPVPAGLRIVPLILLLFPLPVAAVLGR